MEKNLLLRVYGFRKKFCYLIKKIPRGKNTVQRERSACVEEHFNGFNLVKKLTENSIRQLYRLIDIVYKPVSDINQIINCFFAVSMRNPYRVVSNKTKKKLFYNDCWSMLWLQQIFYWKKISRKTYECLWAFSGNSL